MTRADDLRAALVQQVNAYILDNLDPALGEEEDEAIHEAGDIVNLVLQAAYERTMMDLADVAEAMRQAQFAARRPDGSLAYEPEPTPQTWWETWPAAALVHTQEPAKDVEVAAEPPADAPPVCICDSDLACPVHDPELFEAGIPVDD